MSATSLLQERFDPYFKKIGLEPKAIVFGKGRSVRAALGERELTVNCSKRSRTKYVTEDIRYRKYVGHQLTISLSHSLKTRITVQQRSESGSNFITSAISRLLKLQELTFSDHCYQSLRILASDPEWAKQLLEREEVKEILRHKIFSATKEKIHGGMGLQPDILSFSRRLPLSEVDEQLLEDHIDGLQRFLEIAETIPAPTVTAELRWFERRSRSFAKRYQDRPILAACLVLAALFAIVILLTPLFIISLPITMPVFCLWFVFGKWMR